MAQIHRRPTVVPDRRDRPLAETVTGVVATLMAALGAWLYWGPEDGVLQVLAWEWNVTDIHAAWGLGLLMTAAVMGTIAVALATTRRTG